MKRVLLVIVVVVALLATIIYVFRAPLREGAENWITSDMFVRADAAIFNPGPKTGSHFPGIRATFKDREITLIEEFSGPNGVILIALRSVDWCPYCKKQLIQLQESKALFDANGIGLVAITYDDPALQAAFSAAHDISIPILSDTDALTFRTLGILNQDYKPGDDNYGIPYPGMIIVGRNGEVVSKLFVEQYSLRVDAKEVLEFAKQALNVERPL